jgi:DNA (cytosine-5)-methyltransferase 1
MKSLNVGSVCSGIEAASVAWGELGCKFSWFSEISTFPSKVLKAKYPNVENLGDMCSIPEKIRNHTVNAPDLICGGTPCQAFSLAGWKKGLEDVRGNLTLKFVDIIDANDEVRLARKLSKTIVFWENVEGVLRDKTNAFGCFLASLAGLDQEIEMKKWPQSGVIRGPKRNIAWRVIDAKYFGLPQQRRRLYVIAGGTEFNPEEILIEHGTSSNFDKPLENNLTFKKNGVDVEVFRNYTDCLYSAYGTKWNGNAAAYNGSLFVLQNKRLRRFTPLECERLMGFPDNYTEITGATSTTRFQATGNSWAVPVVRWLGQRILNYVAGERNNLAEKIPEANKVDLKKDVTLFTFDKQLLPLSDGTFINGTLTPLNPVFGDIKNIIDTNAEEKYYITPVGCKGILRRKIERQLTINPRLEAVLSEISSKWSDEKIDQISMKQSRGKYSKIDNNIAPTNLNLW